MTHDPSHATQAATGSDTEISGETPFLYKITGQTPWWIVSVLLHGFIVCLAGLISMVVELPSGDSQATVIVTDIFERKENATAALPEKLDMKSLDNPRENQVRTKDDNPANALNVPVTDEMWKLAEHSDRNTTDNGALDENGMRGDPNAKIIYLARGETGDPGGSPSDAVVSEDLIGMGGGFVNTSGHGPGIGNNDGPGDSTFGKNRVGSNKLRLIDQGHGDRKERVLNGALQWLAYHQEADGHWDARKYGASVKTDTAITSLSLLAFLGAGHTERIGTYKENVKLAVAWLKSKQAANGLIWDSTDDGARHRAKGYPGAIATLAIAEAAGMSNVPDTKAAAQRAIDYATETHQNGDGSDKRGWRYGPNDAGDLSVTGWYIMALKSAKLSGLHVNPAAFDGALRFLDSVEHKNPTTDSGYAGISQFWYMPNEEHASSAHRLTAIGALARLFTGTPRTSLQATVDWLVEKGGIPDYGANGEKVDLYYWYYGSMCVFQQGPKTALWKRWNEGMKKAFAENQCKQGDDLGSWSPVGEFSGEWGRVGQTALGGLCMEVYYRYLLLGE